MFIFPFFKKVEVKKYLVENSNIQGNINIIFNIYPLVFLFKTFRKMTTSDSH